MKPTLLALALLLPLSVQAATDIQRWRNRDGTQILLVERHENPIIDLEVSFKGAGSVANPDGKSQDKTLPIRFDSAHWFRQSARRFRD